MLKYAINFEDDEGTFLVTCPDLPEVVTFGETRKDAIHYAKGAIEEIICARFALGKTSPRQGLRAKQWYVLPLIWNSEYGLNGC